MGEDALEGMNESEGPDESSGNESEDTGAPEEAADPEDNNDSGGSNHESTEGPGGDDGPQNSEETQHPRRRWWSPLHISARVVVALLSISALVVTGYAYTTLDQLQSSVTTTDAIRESNDNPGEGDDEDPGHMPPDDDGTIDILLVGSDARTDMQGKPLSASMLRKLRTENKPGAQTDMLMILRLPEDGTPTGVSILRDSWVDVPHGEQGKINSVYGVAKEQELARLRNEGTTDRAERERQSDHKGRKALVQTMQDFTGIRIDHYAEVNLLGFYLLTETLGGVEVCLNQATSDPDSGANFRAGPQVVSGVEALSFVRQRKNLPRGDLDRIVRQQAFLASALNQVLSAGTLADPDRLEELTDTMRRSLVLDSDLSLLEFAEQIAGMTSGEFSFVTIPVVETAARSPDGQQSIVTVDVPQVRSFLKDLVEHAPEPAGGGSLPVAAPAQITAGGVPCVN